MDDLLTPMLINASQKELTVGVLWDLMNDLPAPILINASQGTFPRGSLRPYTPPLCWFAFLRKYKSSISFKVSMLPRSVAGHVFTWRLLRNRACFLYSSDLGFLSSFSFRNLTNNIKIHKKLETADMLIITDSCKWSVRLTSYLKYLSISKNCKCIITVISQTHESAYKYW